MSDGRADRLRNRRKEREEQSDQSGPADKSDTNDTTDTSEETDGDETTDTSDTSDWAEGALKDVGTEKRLYLPDDLLSDLEYHYSGFAREIEHEHGVQIEKNRHWYPLVAELGLSTLVEMEPDDVLDELRERDYIDE